MTASDHVYCSYYRVPFQQCLLFSEDEEIIKVASANESEERKDTGRANVSIVQTWMKGSS